MIVFFFLTPSKRGVVSAQLLHAGWASHAGTQIVCARVEQSPTAYDSREGPPVRVAAPWATHRSVSPTIEHLKCNFGIYFYTTTPDTCSNTIEAVWLIGATTRTSTTPIVRTNKRKPARRGHQRQRYTFCCARVRP